MAANAEQNMERFKGENHSAFVVGYTGEVGKALVKDLNKLKIFKRVVLLGRREVTLDVGPEIEQKVVNFDKLEEEHADLFTGLDVGFCCLGTTRGRAGKEGFVKVDRDYVLATARASKAAGCQQFSLVSSTGADSNGMLLYTQTKGEAEEGTKKVGFDRLSIYRPA
ncbi:oxidoreductase HTATIP2 [Elysia marginata]|uniref:Protein HTATIP2 n=1 Tax=Elysia marginata TaxID=1093978 RepID=A0AAV4JV57_9GAST|nr:oxidoreductase HTATIP2 [Elysia marginata]